MRKYFLVLAVLGLIIAGVFEVREAIAISQSDFQNVVFNDNRGSVDDANRGHVTYNIGKGWNLVPLKFIMGSSGRYWGNFKEGRTCNQDIFQNVWYYSPVTSSYYHIPVMDDWGAPKTRNNDVLLNEFKAKYYHIYAGSAWIYSPKNCILEGDDGTQLVSGNYGDAEQEKGYQYKELVLKAGWNFVPVDLRMAYYEKSLKDLFDFCGAMKFYKYDMAKNKWTDLTMQVNQGNKLVPSNIFETYLVKTTKDCNFADYEAISSSNPPGIPQMPDNERASSNTDELTIRQNFGSLNYHSVSQEIARLPQGIKQESIKYGNIITAIVVQYSTDAGSIFNELLENFYLAPDYTRKITKGVYDIYKTNNRSKRVAFWYSVDKIILIDTADGFHGDGEALGKAYLNKYPSSV